MAITGQNENLITWDVERTCIIAIYEEHDFQLKMHQKRRLSAGLRPDPLGKLTALPQITQLDLRMGPSEQGRNMKKNATACF